MSDNKMVQVICGTDYKLDILLENGVHIIYNLEPKLVTARFQELSDMEVFRSGRVLNGKFIRFCTGAEISLDEVMMNMKSGICG